MFLSVVGQANSCYRSPVPTIEEIENQSVTRGIQIHRFHFSTFTSPSPCRFLSFSSVSLPVCFVGWWSWLSVEAQEFVQAFAGVELFAGACIGVGDDALVEVH